MHLRLLAVLPTMYLQDGEAEKKKQNRRIEIELLAADLCHPLFTFVDGLPQQIQIPLGIPPEDVEDVVHEVIVLDCKLRTEKSRTSGIYHHESLIRTQASETDGFAYVNVFLLELGAIRENLRISDLLVHRVSFFLRNGACFVIHPVNVGEELIKSFPYRVDHLQGNLLALVVEVVADEESSDGQAELFVRPLHTLRPKRGRETFSSLLIQSFAYFHDSPAMPF